MVLRFPKTANQIDKLADHQLASLIYKERHFKTILKGIMEKITIITSQKHQLEAEKSKYKTDLEPFKWKEEAGKLTTMDRKLIKIIEQKIATIDNVLEERVLETETLLKSIDTAVRLFRLDVEKTMGVMKKEIQLTDEERRMLKAALKASLPMKKLLKR